MTTDNRGSEAQEHTKQLVPQTNKNKDSNKKTMAVSASGTKTTTWFGTDTKQQQWQRWH